jgi:hypothetical protein
VVISGEWVLVTDSGGMNFYIGNGPASVGTFTTPAGMTKADKPRVQFRIYREEAAKALGHPVSAREADAYWFSKTWQYIRSHPLRWSRLMVEKVWLFWNAREIPNVEDYDFTRSIQPVLALPFLQFGVLAPLSLLGLVLFLRTRRPDERIIIAMIVALCTANVLVFILARYRLASVPALMLAGVGGARWLVETCRRKAWSSLVPTVLALVPVIVLVWTPKLPRSFESQYIQYGIAAYQQKDLPGAEWAFLQAAEINLNSLDAFKNLGVIYREARAWQRAREAWQQVERIAAVTQQAQVSEVARGQLELISREAELESKAQAGSR